MLVIATLNSGCKVYGPCGGSSPGERTRSRLEAIKVGFAVYQAKRGWPGIESIDGLEEALSSDADALAALLGESGASTASRCFRDEWEKSFQVRPWSGEDPSRTGMVVFSSGEADVRQDANGEDLEVILLRLR
ncbi:MAG: hypothetical protein HYY18_02220 [Planctomycetes bacterium]|nr:hypothetical protein [Planctomycetota bacterium]